MSQEILLPIPQYPPFTLRSSLIDKDPVIWVHLLESYIQLFHLLMEDNFQYLSVKSKQQLYAFIKSYLNETYGEENKIFSLGKTNVEIQKNEQELKKLVFNTIKLYSLVKFNLIGESIWHFIGIYVKGNNSVVRGLVDGSFKSKLNDNKKSGKISSIASVQTHLEKMMMNGKFTTKDLECLSMLLGQSVSSVAATTIGFDNKERVGKSINKKASIEFAEKFVDANWIDILERSFADGRGIHAQTAKEVMIISLISLPAAPLLKLSKAVGIESATDLAKRPLFGSLLISPELQGLISGLEERVGSLVPQIDNVLDDGMEPPQDAIDSLTGIFPDMTAEKAKVFLRQHNNSAEEAINLLLENPGLISEIEVSKPKPVPTSVPKSKPKSAVEEDFTTFKSKKKQNVRINSLDEKLKETTMKLAMSSLEDDDEADIDIYDQFEKYVTEKQNPDDDDVVAEDSKKDQPNAQIEYLQSVYKSEGITPFLSQSRDKTIRKHMKESTGWSDRLIEEWGTMLMLQLKDDDKDKDKNQDKAKPKTKTQTKKDQKYNDRYKASRANHNRKRGHDKKARLEGP